MPDTATTAPPTTEILVNKLPATLVLMTWFLLGLSVFALFGTCWFALGKGEIVAALALSVGAFLLVFASFVCGSNCLRTLRVDGPLLVFTEQSFHDKRISHKPIPWSAIQWRAVHIKNGSIQMDVNEACEQLMFNFAGDRWNAAFCRRFGYPRYTISPVGTGHSTCQLEQIFARYKEPMPKTAPPRSTQSVGA